MALQLRVRFFQQVPEAVDEPGGGCAVDQIMVEGVTWEGSENAVGLTRVAPPRKFMADVDLPPLDMTNLVASSPEPIALRSTSRRLGSPGT